MNREARRNEPKAKSEGFGVRNAHPRIGDLYGEYLAACRDRSQCAEQAAKPDRNFCLDFYMGRDLLCAKAARSQRSATIKLRHYQISRQRKEIQSLQRAGNSTLPAEALLARMQATVDNLCAERDKLVGEQRISYPGTNKVIKGPQMRMR
jgi:hypothetical protein